MFIVNCTIHYHAVVTYIREIYCLQKSRGFFVKLSRDQIFFLSRDGKKHKKIKTIIIIIS